MEGAVLQHPSSNGFLDRHSLKTIEEVLQERRATAHFDSRPVPGPILESILYAGTLAPSGYNLQPWRFVVVQDAKHRQRLQKVSMDQPKVGEAPVVIIAVGMTEEPKEFMHEVFLEGMRNGVGSIENVKAQETQARAFLDSMSMEVWVNRHTMIAVTTMMLTAEAYGIDTAPMEGFDPAGVKREFDIPEEGEVVCLLALGYAKEPDKAYPGRFSVPRVCFSERFGSRWR